jgi:hypothetical protein
VWDIRTCRTQKKKKLFAEQVELPNAILHKTMYATKIAQKKNLENAPDRAC